MTIIKGTKITETIIIKEKNKNDKNNFKIQNLKT